MNKFVDVVMKNLASVKTYLLMTLPVVMSLLFACGEPDHKGMYEEIRSVDKMVFARMSITKTAKYENSEWYKIGKRIAVYSYDTYMRAYIDLSQLTPDDLTFNEKDKTVRITLPAVQTEVTGRDMTLRKEYENIGLLRSNMDSKERAEIKEKANESFVNEIRENPKFKRQLTESAQRKARKYFETLCNRQGYTAVVEFKN